MTWIIKAVFADSINNAIGGIVDVLFINPYPPYWYLYVLFFIFLAIPTIKSAKSMGLLLTIAAVMKLILCAFPELPLWKVYAVYGVTSYTIWFALGMGLAIIGTQKVKKRAIGLILLVAFMGLSIYTVNISNSYIVLGMTTLACVAVFMIMVPMESNTLLDKLAPYTMPVFLMHTLIAAQVRIVLVNAGIMNPLVHIFVGLLASILGPVIAIKIMEKTNLDILVYPGKRIRIKA